MEYCRGTGRSNTNIFNSEIPDIINSRIDKLNTTHYREQKQSIEKTISLIKNKPNLTQLNHIIAEQVTYARQWCKKYEIPINTASTFIEKKP